jgi:sulfonate transport system permease protein
MMQTATGSVAPSERRPVSMTAGRRLRRVNFVGLATVALLILVWEGSIDFGLLNLTSVPSPSATAREGWPIITSSAFYSDLGHTLEVTLVGWLLASVAGIALGLILGSWRPAWRFSMASVEVLRGIPGIAFLMITVVIFGLSMNMELALVVYVVIWPVLVNTVAGTRTVTRTHSDLATLLRMSRMRRIRTVVIPSAMPHIAVALRIGLASALSLAVVAEMIGNPKGIGYKLILEQQGLHPARLFTFVITIGVVGLLLNMAFLNLFRLLAPGANHVLREQ